MIHQMSTECLASEEYVLRCTCRPTGILFIGSKEGCARNMVQHQDETKRHQDHGSSPTSCAGRYSDCEHNA